MPDPGEGASPQQSLEAVLRIHRDVVVAALLDLACHASSEATRLAALKEMLDRGWGKAAAPAADTPPAPVAPTLLIAPALLRPDVAQGQGRE